MKKRTKKQATTERPFPTAQPHIDPAMFDLAWGWRRGSGIKHACNRCGSRVYVNPLNWKRRSSFWDGYVTYFDCEQCSLAIYHLYDNNSDYVAYTTKNLDGAKENDGRERNYYSVIPF
jgi:hypothetical protein